MKKRLVAALLILMVFSTSLFAAVLQFGPTVSYDIPVDLDKETPVDLEGLDLKAITTGADLRFNVAFLQAQMEARGSFDKELRLNNFDLYGAAGLRFNLIVADLTVGGGIRVNGHCEEGKWTFNGQQPDDVNAILNASELYYKAGFALNFGKISLSAEAIAPLNMTVEGLSEVKNQSVLDALTPDLAKTQVSVGLLLNVF